MPWCIFLLPFRFELQFSPNTIIVTIPKEAPIHGAVPPVPSSLTASQLLELPLVVEQVGDVTCLVVAASEPIVSYTK